MRPEDAEEFTQSLGQITAGAWRQIALAERLGVPKALGLTTREWAEERLGGYVRLSIPDRREAVAELTEEGLGTSAVADVLGVDASTVRGDKREISRAAEDREPETREIITEDQMRERESSRIAILPDDLAERVRSGNTPLAEAEKVVGEREKHVAQYAQQVRDSLDLLARMVGHPIPRELTKRLSPDERKLLSVVIGALKEGKIDEYVAA